MLIYFCQNSDDDKFSYERYTPPEYDPELHRDAVRQKRLAKRGNQEKTAENVSVTLFKDELIHNGIRYLNHGFERDGSKLDVSLKHMLLNGLKEQLTHSDAQRVSKEEFASHHQLITELSECRFLLDKTTYEVCLKEGLRRKVRNKSKSVNLKWYGRYLIKKKEERAKKRREARLRRQPVAQKIQIDEEAEKQGQVDDSVEPQDVDIVPDEPPTVLVISAEDKEGAVTPSEPIEVVAAPSEPPPTNSPTLANVMVIDKASVPSPTIKSPPKKRGKQQRTGEDIIPPPTKAPVGKMPPPRQKSLVISIPLEGEPVQAQALDLSPPSKSSLVGSTSPLAVKSIIIVPSKESPDRSKSEKGVHEGNNNPMNVASTSARRDITPRKEKSYSERRHKSKKEKKSKRRHSHSEEEPKEKKRRHGSKGSKKTAASDKNDLDEDDELRRANEKEYNRLRQAKFYSNLFPTYSKQTPPSPDDKSGAGGAAPTVN